MLYCLDSLPDGMQCQFYFGVVQVDHKSPWFNKVINNNTKSRSAQVYFEECVEKSNILNSYPKNLSLIYGGGWVMVKLIIHGAVLKVIYVMSSEARHLSIDMKRPLASLEVTAFF